MKRLNIKYVEQWHLKGSLYLAYDFKIFKDYLQEQNDGFLVFT